MDESRSTAASCSTPSAIAVTVALLCGLLPAIRTSQRQPRRLRRASAGRSHGVALAIRCSGCSSARRSRSSVTLLASAGLLVRSFQEFWRLDPGLRDPARVLTFRISGSWAETADYGRLVQRVDGTLDAIARATGVAAAATAIFLPGVPAQLRVHLRVGRSARRDRRAHRRRTPFRFDRLFRAR